MRDLSENDNVDKSLDTYEQPFVSKSIEKQFKQLSKYGMFLNYVAILLYFIPISFTCFGIFVIFVKIGYLSVFIITYLVVYSISSIFIILGNNYRNNGLIIYEEISDELEWSHRTFRNSKEIHGVEKSPELIKVAPLDYRVYLRRFLKSVKLFKSAKLYYIFTSIVVFVLFFNMLNGMGLLKVLFEVK